MTNKQRIARLTKRVARLKTERDNAIDLAVRTIMGLTRERNEALARVTKLERGAK